MSEEIMIKAWIEESNRSKNGVAEVLTLRLIPGENDEPDLLFQMLLTQDEADKLGLSVAGVNDDNLVVMGYMQHYLNASMIKNRISCNGMPLVTNAHFLPPAHRARWVQNWAKAIQQETAELIDSCPWKWWKDMEFDEQNAKVEAVDLLHFLLSLFHTLGMSPVDVMEAYVKKNMVNHQRQNQEGGYTHKTKDPDDSRHI